MTRVSFLRPIDQFDGTHRFLEDLKTSLQSSDYNYLRLSVAFAKIGPLLRLAPFIRVWKHQGKQIEAIFGVDLNGTSKQALEFALHSFDKVYILHSATPSTFHPKFYLFTGGNMAVCFQGSHNLTVGGTETNLEGGVRIDFDLPQDQASYDEALSTWESLLPNACPMAKQLDATLLEALVADNIVFDETIRLSSADTPSTLAEEGRRTQTSFPRKYPKPPSSLPAPLRQPRQSAASQLTSTTASTETTVTSNILVIEIDPHRNGEVFLSKLAVGQNPVFFGFPFTGQTTPKFARNPSYPQRDPDPIVNVTVYDATGRIAFSKSNFQLNTVFYKNKAEIRITFSPDILAQSTTTTIPYPVMVMRQSSQGRDYDIEIYRPGSQIYQQYLGACNQSMPSGGRVTPRKWGWL